MSAQRDTLYKSVYASCMGKKVIRILPELKHNGKTNSIIQYTAYDMVYANVATPMQCSIKFISCVCCVCVVYIFICCRSHTHIMLNPLKLIQK